MKRYADALWKIVEERNIKVNLRTNLIEVKPEEKVAIFQNLDKPEEKTKMEVIFSCTITLIHIIQKRF